MTTITVQPVWFVNTAATTTVDGLSWATAFHTVQAAVNAAGSGDQVWIASGTYAGTGVTQVQMIDDVDIYGSFHGDERFLSARPYPLVATIFDATALTGSAVVGANATLGGVLIENATAAVSGAGLDIPAGVTMTVNQATFTNNGNAGLGAAIYLDTSASLSGRALRFFGNTGVSGAALYAVGGGVVAISDAVLDGNTVSGGSGGAMAIGAGGSDSLRQR